MSEVHPDYPGDTSIWFRDHPTINEELIDIDAYIERPHSSIQLQIREALRHRQADGCVVFRQQVASDIVQRLQQELPHLQVHPESQTVSVERLAAPRSGFDCGESSAGLEVFSIEQAIRVGSPTARLPRRSSHLAASRIPLDRGGCKSNPFANDPGWGGRDRTDLFGGGGGRIVNDEMSQHKPVDFRHFLSLHIQQQPTQTVVKDPRGGDLQISHSNLLPESSNSQAPAVAGKVLVNDHRAEVALQTQTRSFAAKRAPNEMFISLVRSHRRPWFDSVLNSTTWKQEYA